MQRGMAHAWETAARYHMFHAVALLALAGWIGRTPLVGPARRGCWAAWAWTIGTLLFSGSLYLLAVGGPRWLGPVTPIGGLVLIAGWFLVASAAFAKPDEA